MGEGFAAGPPQGEMRPLGGQRSTRSDKRGGYMTHRLTLAQIAAACAADGSGLPMPAPPEGGAFAEPWQAHAFALTLLLHQRGLFTWGQWAAALAAEIKRAQAAGDADDGSSYYRHWLNALEQLTITRQLGTAQQIHALEHAWEAAAARTLHGRPIELSAADLRQSG